jgi:hypothetical protein
LWKLEQSITIILLLVHYPTVEFLSISEFSPFFDWNSYIFLCLNVSLSRIFVPWLLIVIFKFKRTKCLILLINYCNYKQYEFLTIFVIIGLIIVTFSWLFKDICLHFGFWPFDLIHVKIKAQYIFYFYVIIDFDNTVVIRFLKNAYIKVYRCIPVWQNMNASQILT